ncbi:MAG: hypothetical protein RLZZ338_805, partial [Cyanobacteriota bacterium]
LRRIIYQFGSSFIPKLASVHYIGEWESEHTLVGTIAIPGITEKIQTSATFAPDGQLIKISVRDRTLSRY